MMGLKPRLPVGALGADGVGTATVGSPGTQNPIGSPLTATDPRQSPVSGSKTSSCRPDASSNDRLAASLGPTACRGQDMMTTPSVATMMAAASGNVTLSPRKTRPKIATCTGSILFSAVMRTNDLSRMASSSMAVAANWVAAPANVHASMRGLSTGNGSPVATKTTARNSSANGRPNRKRTCVAPTVPSVLISSRCMALRSV